jgi:hypothetical protein
MWSLTSGGGFHFYEVRLLDPRVLVYLAERADGRRLMKRDGHLNGMGKHLETFHRPQAPAANIRSVHTDDTMSQVESNY